MPATTCKQDATRQGGGLAIRLRSRACLLSPQPARLLLEPRAGVGATGVKPRAALKAG